MSLDTHSLSPTWSRWIIKIINICNPGNSIHTFCILNDVRLAAHHGRFVVGCQKHDSETNILIVLDLLNDCLVLARLFVQKLSTGSQFFRGNARWRRMRRRCAHARRLASGGGIPADTWARRGHSGGCRFSDAHARQDHRAGIPAEVRRAGLPQILETFVEYEDVAAAVALFIPDIGSAIKEVRARISRYKFIHGPIT